MTGPAHEILNQFQNYLIYFAALMGSGHGQNSYNHFLNRTYTLGAIVRARKKNNNLFTVALVIKRKLL